MIISCDLKHNLVKATHVCCIETPYDSLCDYANVRKTGI